VTLPDLGALARVLSDSDVKYIVIGGVAVGAHQFVRATEDLDIVPEPDHANLDRLGNALVRIDARLTLTPEQKFGRAERAALYGGRNMSLSTNVGELDVIQRLPGVPSYEQLAANAWETEILGTPVCVCSREHLIAMKRARGNTLDQADLEALDGGDAGQG